MFNYAILFLGCSITWFGFKRLIKKYQFLKSGHLTIGKVIEIITEETDDDSTVYFKIAFDDDNLGKSEILIKKSSTWFINLNLGQKKTLITTNDKTKIFSYSDIFLFDNLILKVGLIVTSIGITLYIYDNYLYPL
jgi:hypothetical protein